MLASGTALSIHTVKTEQDPASMGPEAIFLDFWVVDRLESSYLEAAKRCLVFAAPARLVWRGGVGVAADAPRPLPLPLLPFVLPCTLPLPCIISHSLTHSLDEARSATHAHEPI